jgi:Integral membrane protein DUF92
MRKETSILSLILLAISIPRPTQAWAPPTKSARLLPHRGVEHSRTASSALRLTQHSEFILRARPPSATQLAASRSALLEGTTTAGTLLLRSLFRSDGGSVPVIPSVILNAALFLLLRTQLLTMLTPSGFVHAFLLGSGLWATIGWRGWSTCVLYLFLGQLVTKIKFQAKSDRGLAESRGGRRGPENVW